MGQRSHGVVSSVGGTAQLACVALRTADTPSFVSVQAAAFWSAPPVSLPAFLPLSGFLSTSGFLASAFWASSAFSCASFLSSAFVVSSGLLVSSAVGSPAWLDWRFSVDAGRGVASVDGRLLHRRVGCPSPPSASVVDVSASETLAVAGVWRCFATVLSASARPTWIRSSWSDRGAGVDGAIVVVSPPRSPMNAWTPWTAATTSCTPTAQF